VAVIQYFQAEMAQGLVVPDVKGGL
jgi:hypothetical protein